jgi:hypothetical protein
MGWFRSQIAAADFAWWGNGECFFSQAARLSLAKMVAELKNAPIGEFSSA